MAMHRFANPARFLKFARPASTTCLVVGLLLLIPGLYGGLFITPPDYQQGDSARILYIHVPAAWLGMAAWGGIAAASLSTLVWRHPLGAVAGRAIAPVGALFAFLCLATGSIWGKPTWGTWWQWEGRLTSMLILFFLYLAYIALAGAERERGGEGRGVAILGVVGIVMLPIIRYSVDFWQVLHQKNSIDFIRGESSIADELLWPLPLTVLGFTFIFAAIVFIRMRTDMAQTKLEARLRRQAGDAA